MTYDVNTGFSNQERLKYIREEVLNPVAVRTKTLMDQMGEVRPLAKSAFQSHTKNLANKTITLRRTEGSNEVIDLTGMFREGSDLALVDKSGNPIPNVSEISFHDSTITNQGSGKADISYDWDKLVPDHQEKMTVSKFDQPATQKPKHLIFKGPTTTVNHSGDTTTVIIPESTPIKGSIGTGSSQNIEEIKLVGNTSNSSFSGTTLQIHIPESGGGGGGITNQNFKGFYDSLGDIESQVTDAISGKSYAFAKDSKLGGTYYTPYFYVNNNWSELKQDPALTYSGPSDPQTHGVFSIKPDSRITVDNLGQIDLSKLSGNGFFEGFYETQEALVAAVPNPTLDKSFAYVKVGTTGAWVAQYYTNNSSGNTWLKVAPQGAMPFVELNTDGSIKTMQNFYAVKKNSKMSVDKSGLLSFEEADVSAINVSVIGQDGSTSEGKVDTIEFDRGKSYATIEGKKLTLTHPQSVIAYDSNFESAHNSRDYEGNIYYDETSRCWMGWGVPEAAGGTDVKWTRIAHPKMSEEVKDLLNRLPHKAPYVTPGILGDETRWGYNSWTYVKKDDLNIPESFRDRCGAYFITIVQDVENDTARPQERYQICYADEDNGAAYVRRWNRTATTGNYGWKDWTKISMSQKDIDDHNKDPNAHNDVLRFYKVMTLDMTIKEVKEKTGIFFEEDLLLLADSHGSTPAGGQYTVIPYDGNFKFSGRLEMDGWGSAKTFPKLQSFVYVYKTVGTQSTIIGEFSYNHDDHTKPYPPLKWATGQIPLKHGDKIHFELKNFGSNPSDTFPDLAFIPTRTYFVIEDARTSSGSRIAKTFERTIGSTHTQKNVGVNVHYNSGTSGAIRVYGVGLPNQTNMVHIKG